MEETPAEMDVQEPAPKEDVSKVLKRANRAFGPIAAGIIIDVIDFATFGPIGFILGLPVGGLAGFWMGRCLGLSKIASFYCAIAAGIYCTIPFTELIPLATMVGAYVRFKESAREEK
jgi:hypothetical protein